jgi:hypothetical protein
MRRPPLALLLLALVVLLACTKARTQIILLVETDMTQGPGAMLTHVRVTVGQPGAPPRSRLTYPLGPVAAGDGRFALPGTLGIAALDNDGSRSVEVRVDAINDPTGVGSEAPALFTYSAIAPFEEERTLLMRVFLAGRCRLAPPCEPGFTCGRERCEAIRRTLSSVSPDFRLDAGSSVPTDASDDLASDLPTDAAADLVVTDGSGGCPASQVRCDNLCVDARTDVLHCGACGNRCPAGANAVAGCAAGVCALSCAQGFADCDGNAANGCEVDLRVNARHCGSCAVACSSVGANPACVGGACRLTCNPGRGDCDGMIGTGCETDLTTTSNCGVCGMVCSLPGVSTPRCVAGECAVGTCEGSRRNCDGRVANGCEVDSATDNAHCGECMRPCPAGQMCSGGVCGTTCGTGLTACMGACANLASSTLHCGACGNACPARPHATSSCARGACGIICDSGFADCNNDPVDGCEVDTRGDERNCGACARVCALANATAVCVAGSCQLEACAAGFGNCDANATNGCEADVLTSAANCGACGTRCALPNATASCGSGRCAIQRCDAGFADCDGNAANGCETSTATPTNCGACRQVCAPANAAPGCAGGVCAILSCNGSWADCDGNVANGCEVDLASDRAHCGACGRACAAGMLCSARVCTTTCALPTLACGMDCVDVASDPAHCGACGRRCTARARYALPLCRSGVCSTACEAGWGDCDGMEPTGCETQLNSLAHCGACRLPCELPNATESCATGACRVVSCDAGWADCNGMPLDGCETRVSDNPMACGGCGIVCAAGPRASSRCTAGRCELLCDAGYVDCDLDPRNGCELEVGGRCTTANGCSMGVLDCDDGRRMGVCRAVSPLPCMVSCPPMTMPSGFCDGAGNCVMGAIVCAGDAGVTTDGGVVLTDGGMVRDDLGRML